MRRAMLIGFVIGFFFCLATSATVVGRAHWVRERPHETRAHWLQRAAHHYRYVASVGRGAPRRSHTRALTWVRHEMPRTLSPVAAICAVFNPCDKALAVAWCESRFSVYARNGQYLGLFQEGDYARATYGFGWTALEQARSAHAYWMDAGWTPWECA